MIYELPMTNDASQEFVGPIAGVKYLFRVQLNVRCDFWTLDINTIDDIPIITGQPLVLGVDFLSNERFAAGMLFLADYTGKGLDPVAGNLKNFGLIWTDNYV